MNTFTASIRNSLRFGLLLLSCANLAAANFTSVLTAEKRVEIRNDDGATTVQYKPFELALPGERIRYSITYDYSGDKPASQVSIQGKVPPEMILVAGSDAYQDALVTYSVDGGNQFAPIETLTVTNEDGSTRPARIEDIDTIKWSFQTDLAPNATGKIQYETQLK